MNAPKVKQLESARTKSGQTLYTASALAREFKRDRGTVVRKLAGTPPTARDYRGYDGWTLDVAAPLILDLAPAADPAERELRAADENHFYSARLKELQYQREVGAVVPVDQVRARWVDVLKRVVAWVESLADQLERSANLTPKQVEQLEKRIDELRGDLHSELTGGD